MGYLSNRTINHLNIQASLLGLMEQAFGIFVPIYLYKNGFSLPEVFLLFALFNTARIPLRLLSFPIVRLVGLKYALMIGTVGYCLTFPLLSMVKAYDLWMLLYLLIFGTFNALHWHCFHTFYSMAGEQEHRGKQISVAAGLGTAVSALAPLLGALFIESSSFEKFFFLPLPLMVMMLMVLNRCQNISVTKSGWHEGKKLMFNLGARIHVAEASAVYPMHIGWIFAVYFMAGEMTTLGSLITFGIIVQIIYQLWIGKVLDSGRGNIIAHIAGALRLMQVLAKAFVPLTIPRVMAIEALNGATSAHHSLSQPTAMYNAGKDAADTFWYWLFAETAFDIGTIFGAGSVALLLWSGVPLQQTILLALPGVLYVWWLTHHYFKSNSSSTTTGSD